MKSTMTLLFKSNNTPIREININDNESYIIGRDSLNVDVCLEDLSISGLHAKLILSEKKLFIIDLGSKNGTFINNQLIEKNQQILLKKNDVIRFGIKSSYELLITEKLSESNEVKKNKQEIIIGRSKDCDIVISNDDTISRKHASITNLGNDSFLLKDLNSTNGVFFKGSRIKESILNRNDFFIIGKNEISATGKIKSLIEQISIKVEGVSKKYNKKTYSLNPLSFEIKSKSITAIMGPSGCGKSTLLKLLNKEVNASTGTISLFGMNLNTNFSYLKKQIGYVPQDDIIHLELTVWQSIYYAAKLRLNNNSESEILDRINHLLKVLKIEKIKNNLNSAISGGQRKRVCIAIELLSNPLMLLLDEPTSPLDPQSIEEFLSILVQLKNEGTTIIMVTHKPEDLAYMDEVIFLSENGYLIYKGNVSNYLSFFNVNNTIDVYSELSGEKADKWINKSSKDHQKYIPVNQKIHLEKEKINWYSQFIWQTIRNIRIKTNDKLNTSILILQAPIIAFLIALIFKEISLGVLFMICISSIWFGVNNSAREIVKEQSIYRRERKFNLAISTYIISKFTTLIIIASIQALLFSAVLFSTYQNSFVKLSSYIEMSIWMIFIISISSLMGFLISALMSSTEKVMSLVPILLIPQIMLAGVITKIENRLVEFISYLTFSRWGNEGFANVQSIVSSDSLKIKVDENNLPIKNEDNLPINEIIQVKKNAVELLKDNYHSDFYSTFGQSSGTFNLDFLVLLFFGVILIISIFIVMKRKDSK